MLRTCSGTGTDWAGAALITPTGDVITKYRLSSAGVDVFFPNGSKIASFPISAADPGDVSVFPDGTIAIDEQRSTSVYEYAENGAYLWTLTLPGAVVDPAGTYLSSHGTLWVVDRVPRCPGRTIVTAAGLAEYVLSADHRISQLIACSPNSSPTTVTPASTATTSSAGVVVFKPVTGTMRMS